jgi:GAF domain-containing protein
MIGFDSSSGLEPGEASMEMSPLLSAERMSAAWEVLTSQLQGAVPGAAGVGISLIEAPATSTSSAATTAVVLAADDAQYRLDEGPCLTAWAKRHVVRVNDLRDDHRWPRWAAAALSLSIRSVVSAPLLTAGPAVGAAKIYSYSPGAFGDQTERLLTDLADTAAILLTNASVTGGRELMAGVRQAIQDRTTVQTAKGIVMRHYRISEEAAARLLMTEAGASGRSMRDVARTVVAATRTSG